MIQIHKGVEEETIFNINYIICFSYKQHQKRIMMHSVNSIIPFSKWYNNVVRNGMPDIQRKRRKIDQSHIRSDK